MQNACRLVGVSTRARNKFAKVTNKDKQDSYLHSLNPNLMPFVNYIQQAIEELGKQNSKQDITQ